MPKTTEANNESNPSKNDENESASNEKTTMEETINVDNTLVKCQLYV